MKQQDITTLKLIQSLENDPEQTQRDLAVELNISLGLVNAFIKRLVNKGHFKVKTIPRNRIRYILTPKGIYEKTRLTYQYLLYSLEFYKETRSKIRSIYCRLSDHGKKRVYLIGTGELAEIALITLKETNIELAGVIDNKNAGKSFLGIPIFDHSALKSLSNDMAIITITDPKFDSLDALLEHFHQTNIIDLCK
jgi:DNA-binding MarR family transcriptional regulator